MCPEGVITGRDWDNNLARQKFMTFILWMFSKEDMHGYGLMKKIEEDKVLPTIPPSRMYPILSDMCDEGYLSCKIKKEGKREKKIYSITAKGKKMLQHAKEHIKKSKLIKEYIKDIAGDIL